MFILNVREENELEVLEERIWAISDMLRKSREFAQSKVYCFNVMKAIKQGGRDSGGEDDSAPVLPFLRSKDALKLQDFVVLGYRQFRLDLLETISARRYAGSGETSISAC